MRKTPAYFRYPPNLNSLDLASVISMYRSRGEPSTAPAGDYYGCAHTGKLIKQAKTWFGLHYSQPAWDHLLSRNSQGYPFTEVEMNVLGLAYMQQDGQNDRDFIEKKCGIMSQLAFLIVNDLKQFGFLNEDENKLLSLTIEGEKALQGICVKIFDQRFTPDMLLINRGRDSDPAITQARRQESNQTDLF